MPTKTILNTLPDIAKHSSPQQSGTIDYVGMTNIITPIKLNTSTPNASSNIFVNLTDPNQKGIHMSRLHNIITQKLPEKPLTPSLLKTILDESINSQNPYAEKGKLDLHFTNLLKQKALISDNWGYRDYPVSLYIEKIAPDSYIFKTEFTITYSSTCPCSAALARQLIQEKFLKDHPYKESFSRQDILSWLSKETSINATPHSQRSHATISLTHSQIPESLDLKKWITEAESILQTPVQAAVKREDEQEFAKRNGQNLMFVEDAIRKLTAWLKTKESLSDYAIQVDHHESLHGHDASARHSSFQSKL